MLEILSPIWHLKAETALDPGTVDEVVRPRLEAGGLRAGDDFFLAFSPERADPGSAEWNTRNIPKVVGGVNARSTEAAAALYRLIVDTVVPVSSARVAEMKVTRQNGFESRFIELAGHVNGGMPRHVVERVAEALNSRSRAVRGSRVHLFGMAYKRTSATCASRRPSTSPISFSGAAPWCATAIRSFRPFAKVRSRSKRSRPRQHSPKGSTAR